MEGNKGDGKIEVIQKNETVVTANEKTKKTTVTLNNFLATIYPKTTASMCFFSFRLRGKQPNQKYYIYIKSKHSFNVFL